MYIIYIVHIYVYIYPPADLGSFGRGERGQLGYPCGATVAAGGGGGGGGGGAGLARLIETNRFLGSCRPAPGPDGYFLLVKRADPDATRHRYYGRFVDPRQGQTVMRGPPKKVPHLYNGVVTYRIRTWRFHHYE